MSSNTPRLRSIQPFNEGKVTATAINPNIKATATSRKLTAMGKIIAATAIINSPLKMLLPNIVPNPTSSCLRILEIMPKLLLSQVPVLMSRLLQLLLR